MSKQYEVSSIIDGWLITSPQWFREAYSNSAIAHRVITNCAIENIDQWAMLWRLAQAMYENGNALQDKLVEAWKAKPPTYIISSGQLDNISHD